MPLDEVSRGFCGEDLDQSHIALSHEVKGISPGPPRVNAKVHPMKLS